MAAVVHDLEQYKSKSLTSQSVERLRKLRLLNEKLDEFRAAREILDIDWMLNAFYVLGKQWVRYDRTLSRYVLDAGESRRVRVLDNELRKNLHRRQARLIRQRGEWGTMPAGPDPEDEAESKGNQQWLAYLWRQRRMDVQYSRAMHNVAIFGNAPSKSYWDPSLGPLNPELERLKNGRAKLASKCSACRGTGMENGGMEVLGFDERIGPPCPMCDGQGGELSYKATRRGDVNVFGKSPFDVWYDPHATDLRDCEGVFERDILSIDEFRRRFPEVGARVVSGSQSDAGDHAVHGLNLMNAGSWATSLGLFARGSPTNNRVEVYTYYARPSTKHPDGQVYRFTRDVFIEQFDWPEPELGDIIGFHPFVHFRDFAIPNSVYGQSVADDARNLQQTLNMLWSQIIEHGKMVVSPPVKQALNAIVVGDVGYPEPGRIIRYNPGIPHGSPEFMQVPNLSGDVTKLLDLLKMAIREIHMVVDQAPEGEVTGRLVALLDEQADKENTPQIVEHRDQLRALGERSLHLAKKYTEDERAFAILGRSRRPEFTVLKPFKSPTDTADVLITNDRFMPDSPLARAEVIKELADLIVDPETGMRDNQRILELLDMSTDAVDRTWQERENAVRENREMVDSVGSQGAMPRAMPPGMGMPMGPSMGGMPSVDPMMQGGAPMIGMPQGMPGMGMGMQPSQFPASPHDDHVVHINGHLREARMYPVNDPRRLVIEAHIAEHKMYLAQAKMAVVGSNHDQIAGGNAPQALPTPGMTMPGGDLASQMAVAGPMIQGADMQGEQSAQVQGAEAQLAQMMNAGQPTA